MKAFLNFELGRDFWNFRLGQLISLLGDSCANIALAWWVLDKTGSAAQMSAVIAPAMLVKILLLPMLGPIADRYSRKTLIMLSDLWRFIVGSLLAAFVFFDYYNLSLLTILFVLSAFGSALFNAASSGIVAQIVEKDKLQVANQQSEAINSIGSILGGIVGGIIVSTVGVFGAFLVDAISYFLSFVFTGFIQANTKPNRKASQKSAMRAWVTEMGEGFQVLYRIPVLFWLCIIAMFMNLALSPLGIILPVLAKESRNMPAWFLGALESSISVGVIVGAVFISQAQKKISNHALLILGLCMIGVGVAVLPWVPNLGLPLSVLFWIGIGATWANIPIGTQVALSVPDSHRGRIGSIMRFLCGGIAPLGVAISGFLISYLGLTKSLFLMGLVVILLAPLMLFISKFRIFMNAQPKEAGEFFAKNYPEAFRDN